MVKQRSKNVWNSKSEHFITYYCRKHGMYTIHELKFVRFEWTYKCVICIQEAKEKAREYYLKRKFREQIWRCARCGELFTHQQLSRGMCKNCRKTALKKELNAIEQRMRDKRDEYHDELKKCTAGGVCDTLHMHHEILKDDPERLTTEFLIEMTCGTELLERYKKKREEQ